MSFDIFLLHCRDKKPVKIGSEIIEELFGPYAISRDDDSFMRVRFPDGSGSDIYMEHQDDGSMMFNYCGGETFFEALFQLLKRTQSFAVWPSTGPHVAVADPATLAHVPDEVTKDPVKVAKDGADLENYIFNENQGDSDAADDDDD